MEGERVEGGRARGGLRGGRDGVEGIEGGRVEGGRVSKAFKTRVRKLGAYWRAERALGRWAPACLQRALPLHPSTVS